MEIENGHVRRTFLGKEIDVDDEVEVLEEEKKKKEEEEEEEKEDQEDQEEESERPTTNGVVGSVSGVAAKLNGRVNGSFSTGSQEFPPVKDRQGHLFRAMTEIFQKENQYDIETIEIPVVEKWKNLRSPDLSSSSSPNREEKKERSRILWLFGVLGGLLVWVLGWLEWIYESCVLVMDMLRSRETVKASDLKKISKLRQKEKDACSYTEWSQIVQDLDVLEGKEAWKHDPKSRLYDYHLIQHRLSLLRGLSSLPTGYVSIKDALRAHLHRDLGGIGSRGLYTYSRHGTKQLILDYVEEVCEQLRNVMDSSYFSLEQKFDFFYETRQSYGRTALLLSGGAALGMYHLGVVKALFQQNLLPNVVSGASAGSIMTTIVGILRDDEMPLLWQPGTIDLRPFTRRRNGQFGRRITRLLREGVLLDVRVLEEALRENVGDITFREAYLRSGKVINITVCSAGGERPRLLNYLTAPNVLLWSAACASCALKFLYKPVELLSKDPDGKVRRYDSAGRKWSDGSVEEDLPMKRLSELFNVNHFIVSQVNPHVYPWVSTDNYKRENPSLFFSAKRLVRNLFLSEIKHRISQLVSLDAFNIFWSLAVLTSQTYTGDITIVPELRISDFVKIISNPNEEYRMHCIKQAERLTWPFISVIRCHTDIEVTLEACYRQCQAQLSQPIRRETSRAHSESKKLD